MGKVQPKARSLFDSLLRTWCVGCIASFAAVPLLGCSSSKLEAADPEGSAGRNAGGASGADGASDGGAIGSFAGDDSTEGTAGASDEAGSEAGGSGSTTGGVGNAAGGTIISGAGRAG